jgi:hypothetical protein
MADLLVSAAMKFRVQHQFSGAVRLSDRTKVMPSYTLALNHSSRLSPKLTWAGISISLK